MYTATLKSKTVQRAKQRLLCVVTISDGTNEHDKEFSFSLNSDLQDVRKVVQQYMDELAQSQDLADQLTVGASITYTPDPDPEPDPEQVAFEAWNKDLQKLTAAVNASALGVEIATAAQITALRNKVQTDMVKTDERYISAFANRI